MNILLFVSNIVYITVYTTVNVSYAYNLCDYIFRPFIDHLLVARKYRNKIELNKQKHLRTAHVSIQLDGV
jgi:hypothetical protein